MLTGSISKGILKIKHFNLITTVGIIKPFSKEGD